MTAVYSLNSEHNGIEIVFNARPDESVLSALRERKWRWHRVKKCWYNIQTEENIDFAKSICNKEVVEAPKDTVPVNVHGVKVGDIFYTSWGYDMTIVQFYQVVRVTAKRAIVKEISKKIVDGDFSGHVIPVKNSFLNKDYITTGTNSYHEGTPILKNCDGHFAYLFTGNPIYFNSLD